MRFYEVFMISVNFPTTAGEFPCYSEIERPGKERFFPGYCAVGVGQAIPEVSKSLLRS